MATKSANLYARIEPDVKEKAENIGYTWYPCFQCYQYVL